MEKSPFLMREKISDLNSQCIGKICSNKCLGSGAYLENGTFVDCTCMTEFKRRIEFVNAGIPKRYWDFSMDDLDPVFVEKNLKYLRIVDSYCSKIKKMVNKGVGLYIQGATGLAKSAIAYYIMKTALKEGITCYSIRMSKLITITFESISDQEKKEQLEWLSTVDLLLIEEIEKVYSGVLDVQSMAGKSVNEFFGELYNSKHSLLVTSNVKKNTLNRVQAENIVDRLSELVDIAFLGESFRKSETFLNEIISEE